MAARAPSPAGTAAAAPEAPTYADGTEVQIEPPMPPGIGGAVPTAANVARMGGNMKTSRRARAQRRLRGSPCTRREQQRLVQKAWESQEAR